MSAQLFTIDKIEGNSNIGVPVFSRFGQMQNFQFLALSPVKKPKEVATDNEKSIIDQVNEKFRIAPTAETETKASIKARVALPPTEQERKNEELVQSVMVSLLISEICMAS